MKKFENMIIGFGKGGKTLAGVLAAAGQSVALIEKSPLMYGGTCINVACIPSKALEHSARFSQAQGGTFRERAVRYRTAIWEKRELTAALRQKNLEKAVSAGVKVILGTAAFLDDHRIRLEKADGTEEVLWGERIFINTGARPFLPPVDGLQSSRFVYTSETMMELETLPGKLVIIGGGYIGLEFASYYRNFGSDVVVLQDSDIFLPREDAEIAAAVLENLEARGIQVLRGIQVQRIRDREDGADLTVRTEYGERKLSCNAVLVATGRRPNLQELHPEAAGIELTAYGAVKTDEHLRTNVPHIWAMGDVAGGLQFTYISLDDSRIVKSQLLGDGSRTTENRGAIPYSVFLDPPLSRVGLTEAEAVKKGHAVKVARLPAAAVPKAKVLRQTNGLLKAIVDAETGQLLGAHLFCAESQELINLLKLAIDAGIPYTELRDAVYTHPTMSEALNDLFTAVT